MTTGQRIKAARKKAGMTQAELAGKLGIPYQSIGQWERDLRSPKIETLHRIANALLISVRELMDAKTADAYDAGIDLGANLEEWQGYVIDELWKREGYSGSDTETQLINAFSQLNDSGQHEAIKRVEELTEIPRYKKETDYTDGD